MKTGPSGVDELETGLVDLKHTKRSSRACRDENSDSKEANAHYLNSVSKLSWEFSHHAATDTPAR